jgi:hypothetical protein
MKVDFPRCIRVEGLQRPKAYLPVNIGDHPKPPGYGAIRAL